MITKFGAFPGGAPTGGGFGTITHQIGPFQTPMYLRSLSLALQLSPVVVGAARQLGFAFFFAVTGDKITVADIGANPLNLGPTLLAQQLIFAQYVWNDGAIMAHFGDREVGPMLIPEGRILTIGCTTAFNQATGAQDPYLPQVTADGWPAANRQYDNVYGKDPSLMALR